MFSENEMTSFYTNVGGYIVMRGRYVARISLLDIIIFSHSPASVFVYKVYKYTCAYNRYLKLYLW
jgi:hypothetical protein